MELKQCIKRYIRIYRQFYTYSYEYLCDRLSKKINYTQYKYPQDQFQRQGVKKVQYTHFFFLVNSRENCKIFTYFLTKLSRNQISMDLKYTLILISYIFH